jgi:outer membrane protein OmpA-like peptidoglycan-associated protein
MGQRITYGLALEVRIWKGLSAIVEGFGQNGFTKELASTPLEIDGALRYRLASGLFFTLGGGGGIIGAVGTPTFRVFGGLVFAPPVKPEVDSDKDGIVDEEDRCPLDPEDKDGFEDADGCPDKDNDKDGILDGEDGCPDKAEDKDGFEDADGCPDKDNDKDGIPDVIDGCPLEAEDADDFDDEDGCPDPDNDKDGFLDADDKCPNEAEDKDDYQDDDGCPDGERPLVVIEKKQIVIKEQINFKLDSDVIIGKKSFDILDAIVAILKENPDIKVRIEGHTDNGGTHTYNMDLSKRRAKAVLKYLVSKGIDKGRLTFVGYGPDKPIADNATDEGRAKNRRVEFHIVEPEPQPPQ